MKGHAIIGFNDGLLGLAENPALGHGFFRQNTLDYALGVLTPKASPLGWVFSQAQQPIIKTYSMEASIGPGNYLGDNDRGCAGVVCEAPKSSGRMRGF